jgi:hypothetical protein
MWLVPNPDSWRAIESDLRPRITHFSRRLAAPESGEGGSQTQPDQASRFTFHSPMKQWAVITVLLYVLILAAITLPMVLLAFGGWGSYYGRGMGFTQALAFYQERGYWVWVGIMGLGEALLLVVPVGIVSRRLTSRRPLIVPVIVCSFLLANLFFSGLLSLLCVTLNDHAFDFIGFTGEGLRMDAPAGTAILDYLFGTLAVIGLLWVMWAVVFYWFARKDEPDALVKRITHWLLRGSVLELLIAVPSHIIARNRQGCCAPFGTFWGIATGLAIMLLCFGPGVFFLFSERMRRLRPK